MNPDTLRDLENMSDRINRLLARRSRAVSARDESTTCRSTNSMSALSVAVQSRGIGGMNRLVLVTVRYLPRRAKTIQANMMKKLRVFTAQPLGSAIRALDGATRLAEA